MGYVHACSGYPESSLARERDERSVGAPTRSMQAVAGCDARIIHGS